MVKVVMTFNIRTATAHSSTISLYVVYPFFYTSYCELLHISAQKKQLLKTAQFLHLINSICCDALWKVLKNFGSGFTRIPDSLHNG